MPGTQEAQGHASYFSCCCGALCWEDDMGRECLRH